MSPVRLLSVLVSLCLISAPLLAAPQEKPQDNPHSGMAGFLVLKCWLDPAKDTVETKLDFSISKDLKLDLEQGRDLYARSDQYSFHREGVPGLFFFEGDLKDNPVYHKPGDVAETIDGEKIARIAQLFAATAYAVANEGLRP